MDEAARFEMDEYDTSQSVWVVNKFGGTSVASAEAMCRVRDIVIGQVRR